MNHQSFPFWQRKTLAEMDQAEWESLCDRCGLCCLIKLEDEESSEIHYTRLACRLLNIDQSCCSNYPQRLEQVEECLKLDIRYLAQFDWLPPSCAYRKLANGEPLEPWHPLISGDPESIHQAGISTRGWAVPETEADPEQYEDFLIELK